MSYPGIIMGVAAFAATLVLSGLTLNRFIRRKLRLSLFLLAAYVIIHLILAFNLDAGGRQDLTSLAKLAFAAGIINALVVSFINPLRVDTVPDRFPTILQEFIVIGLLLLVATFVFHDKLL